MTEKPIKQIYIGSETDKKKKYLVQFFEDGSATCECLYFWHRGFRKGLGQCKHISRATEHFNKKNLDN